MGCRAVSVGLVTVLAVQAAPSKPVIAGLDHVPIAVRDLAQAAEDYQALGFALKPGRIHDDGIENQHVKFADGTELELITAPAARDALTATYRRHLDRGDGPAFMALFAPDMAAADQRLTALRVPHGPNGGAIDFAHANTAESLIGIWLAGDDLSRERRLLEGLGAAIVGADVRVPDRARATVARLQEGDVLLLPGSRQVVPGRHVVGATLRVRSVAAARAVLSRGEPRSLDIVPLVGGRSVFLPPARTHGIWLEFLEPVRRPQ